MDRYLVHQENITGAATHALLIGVGAYPYLIGGTQPTSQYSDGMAQLSSPPISARKLSEWLIENYNNPNQPLTSVSLLLSEDGNNVFANPKSRKKYHVAQATYDNTAKAIEAWALRGRTNPDNLLMFYFCGHGIAQGADMALLMSDYGVNGLAPLEQALNFKSFRLFMSHNLPRRQIYFVDACRANSDRLIETLNATGRSPIQTRSESAAEAPVYYATLAGENAFGKPNEVSVFTTALLKGLNGSGSDDNEEVGQWRVNTSRLKEAIDYHVKREFDAGARRAQVPPTDDLTTFELHHLTGLPEVPVFISCKPHSENANAEFVCEVDGVERDRRQREETEWVLPLPAGKYRFAAEFPLGGKKRIDKEVHVHPVYRRISLEVK